MSAGPKVLVVDDEPDLRWVLRGLLEDAGYLVRDAEDGHSALAAVDEDPPDVVLSDVRMPGMHGLDLLDQLQKRDPDLPVVLLSAVEDIATAVEAMRQGAFDYQPKPFDQERLLHTIGRAAERYSLKRQVRDLKDQLDGDRVSFGTSARAAQIERTLDLVAPQSTLAVLISGESGTGKEVVAREIHRRSPLADGPFVAVDCGALPEALMESQLFGHKKGAFTGADRDRSGLFLMARGGTLFLDELGNLPLGLQAKLLRTIQERVVVPVGGSEPVPFDGRLVCATNADLSVAIRDGSFRMDLYHRIAEFTLHLPSLRERPEDVLHFAERFLAEANREMGRQVTGLAPATREALQAAPWPGNLRELRNTVRRGVLLSAADELLPQDLQGEGGLLGAGPGLASAPGTVEFDPTKSLADQVREATEAMEAELLRQALDREQGNKAAAARALGIDYTTLHRKLKRYGILDSR